MAKREPRFITEFEGWVFDLIHREWGSPRCPTPSCRFQRSGSQYPLMQNYRTGEWFCPRCGYIKKKGGQ